MAKSKSVFFCQKCGAESPKWIGHCPACKEWNTYVEELLVSEKSSRQSFSDTPGRNKPMPINEIRLDDSKRIDTRTEELNRVLGGGLVPGSVVLLGGEPGIGKSTLALQLGLALKGIQVLYVTGEESPEQIRLRAERIHLKNDQLLVLSETSLESILDQLRQMRPAIVIIDSIQTLYTERIDSTPGSVSQIRECAASLLRFAKETGTPVLLIGHITKDGTIAGPKVLEHIVDVVLQFEGDTQHVYRLLRASKNRFGSTAELGIFEMQNEGLREVPNPSEILMGRHEDNLSGIAVAATIEGMRPFLIETQALVSTAAYGTPQRSSTGFDIRRLHMLLAVLEKRAGFKLIARDVFLNIAGGFKVLDPATDLAVICSVLSSAADIAIPGTCCFAAEIGLSGEVRPVNRIDQRISEAEKMGFNRIFVSKFSKLSSTSNRKIEIVKISRVDQVLSQLFG